MDHDYEVFESAWMKDREKYTREVLDQGYSLGVCDDETGECFTIIPGRGRRGDGW